MKISLDNLPEFFEQFELPEDPHERYAVLERLCDILDDIRYEVLKEL